MIVRYTGKKSMFINGHHGKIVITVDLERKEIEVLTMLDGRIVQLSARPPRL